MVNVPFYLESSGIITGAFRTITLEKIAEFVGLSVDEVKNIKIDQNILLTVAWNLKIRFQTLFFP